MQREKDVAQECALLLLKLICLSRFAGQIERLKERGEGREDEAQGIDTKRSCLKHLQQQQQSPLPIEQHSHSS